MSLITNLAASADWRIALPTLADGLVTLREPVREDISALVDILSVPDATAFGIDEPISAGAAERFLERAVRERRAGRSFTYSITVGSALDVVGLIQVRQLDPMFDTAECECTIAPSARGTGLFLEAAQLLASFAFGQVGARRLESRVLMQNGRANGAMRKLGAVEEGVLRQSTRRGSDYFDQILWSLLMDDWRGRWASPGSRVH